jgi:putative transcriptional regulator
MPIVVLLDVMLAKKKMKGRELCARIGISETQLSLLRSGKVRGVRFGTFAKLCAALDCKPGDLLDYQFDAADFDERASDDS